MKHKNSLTALFIVLTAAIVSCTKTASNVKTTETAEQIQAAGEISTSLSRMGDDNDSVIHHHGTPIGHHFDTLFHYHDSLYVHYHEIYHHDDTTHHTGWHHTPIDHHIHDSIITVHQPYH